MFDFTFKDIQSLGQLDDLSRFLLSQSLDYKDYDRWVERSRHEIRSGSKSAITAYSNGIIVGDIIFQGHKSIPNVREIKNIRIDPQLQGRGFAQFMVKQAEIENGNGYDAIMVDAPVNKLDVYGFLIHMGYKPLITVPLYDRNSQDIIFVKNFSTQSRAEEIRQYAISKSTANLQS